MDIGGMNSGLNPLSDKFRQGATQNVQQQMGTLKTSRELEQDHHGKEPRDMVELGEREVTPEQYLKNAAQSGALGEQVPVKKKESKTGTGGEVGTGLVNDADQQAVEESGCQGAQQQMTAIEGGVGIGPKDVFDLGRLKGNVPPEMFEAARKIVEGQIDPVKGPQESLAALKTAPVAMHAQVDTAPLGFHGVLDIHDGNNKPMPILDDGSHI